MGDRSMLLGTESSPVLVVGGLITSSPLDSLVNLYRGRIGPRGIGGELGPERRAREGVRGNAPHATVHTIDHVEIVRDESSCTLPYLTQRLSSLVENIHQYISLTMNKIYLVTFLPLCVLEAPRAKTSQNLPILM